MVDLYGLLPQNERIIVDVLRQLIIDHLPAYCKEKISYNVPFFMGKKVFVSCGLQLFHEEVLNREFC
jgi:hypothetical protein